jgi:hypothetical protein
MYLAATTCPDIAFTINTAAQVMDRQLKRTETTLKAFFATCDQPAAMASGILDVLAN